MTITIEPDRINVSLALSMIAEPGDKELSDLLDEHDDTDEGRKAALDAALDPTDTIVNSAAHARWIPRFSAQGIASARRLVDNLGIEVITQGDIRYPGRLHRLRCAPSALYCRGDVDLLNTKQVAIVGARAATSYGTWATTEIAAGAADAGFTVISGGAYGIDEHAHRSALAAGGKTISVLAGGVDRFYPAGNSDLLQRIANGGLVVSEVAPGTSPTKWRFLERNRLIGALSSGLLVVEAGRRSGSLGAAERMSNISGPVYAVPGPITSPASAGTNHLIREGKARAITSWTELAEDLEANPF